MGYSICTMNVDLINTALRKFPNANRSAVENFTKSYDRLTSGVLWNLDQDCFVYKWHGHTRLAIVYVLKNR